MAAEIERIVDRKTIRGRVHYLVVWRGFGEESNTWESRMDLVADGHSSVIRQYEDNRKLEEDDGSSTPRGRGRAKGSRAKSPGRRSRSNSTARSRSPSASGSRRRSSSKKRTTKKEKEQAATKAATEMDTESKPKGEPRTKTKTKAEAKAEVLTPEATADAIMAAEVEEVVTTTTTKAEDEDEDTPTRRRSARRKTKNVSTLDIDALVENGDEELLRATLASLDHPVTSSTSISTSTSTTSSGSTHRSSSRTTTKTMELAYEGESTSSTDTVVKQDGHASGGVKDLWIKVNEGGWLLWLGSVVVVVASLLASRLLPGGSGSGSTGEDGQWRLWLPFLTPVIALLLVFRQRDARASVKWIAVALSWRCAAELLQMVGGNGQTLLPIALGAFAISNASLLVTLISIVRNKETERSNSTLIVFLLGLLALLLSDSWMVQTQDPVAESRVMLMSIASLTIAWSPVLTTVPDDE